MKSAHVSTRTERLAIVFCCLSLITANAYGIRFHLQLGRRQCFTEDLPSYSRIIGDFQVSAGSGNAEVYLQISSLNGQVVFESQGHDHGKFAFQTLPVARTWQSGIVDDDLENDMTVEDETYRICFLYSKSTKSDEQVESLRMVYFAIDGDDKIDRDAVKTYAITQDTDNLESKLRLMQSELSSFVGDLSSLEQSERRLVSSMGAASRYLTMLANFSLLFIIVVCVVQFKYFKLYFVRNKIC